MENKMACSKTCVVSEIFRCDFCGSLSKNHIHYLIPSTECKFIELFPITTVEFFVCTKQCGLKLSASLTACDLSNGIPYRVQSAYHPSKLSPPNPHAPCYTCKKPNNPGAPHIKAVLTAAAAGKDPVFCRNERCLLAY